MTSPENLVNTRLITKADNSIMISEFLYILYSFKDAFLFLLKPIRPNGTKRTAEIIVISKPYATADIRENMLSSPYLQRVTRGVTSSPSRNRLASELPTTGIPE